MEGEVPLRQRRYCRKAPMETRTREKTVTFQGPFVLAGLDEVLPAGGCRVETEEELIGGVSFAADRTNSLVLRLPVKSGPSHLTRALKVDPNELAAALACDATSAGGPP